MILQKKFKNKINQGKQYATQKISYADVWEKTIYKRS